jgi:hypothetical protein
LSAANLRRANLIDANLSAANLSAADLSAADLSDANLSAADLSDAKGLLSPINWLDGQFEKIDTGIIVFKTFGMHYKPPENWEIKKDSIIEENGINPLPTIDCGSGINFATLEWIKDNTKELDIWKCLIRWEWAAGIVVPYNTDGKARCTKLQLLEII